MSGRPVVTGRPVFSQNQKYSAVPLRMQRANHQFTLVVLIFLHSSPPLGTRTKYPTILIPLNPWHYLFVGKLSEYFRKTERDTFTLLSSSN